MRQIQCQQCSETFDLNATYCIEGRDLCADCAQARLTEHPDTPREEITRNYDPNFCVQCNKDFPGPELPILAGLPCCDSCTAWLRNRPFPLWIKAAFIALLALVAFSFVWNYRFVSAYLDLKAFATQSQAGDYESAAASMKSVSDKVPEQPSLAAYADYFSGINFLTKNRNTEALTMLQSCRGRMSEDESPVLEQLITDAKIGVAFDAGDYDEFLKLAAASAQQNPQSPHHVAQLASANACKYAETGDAKYHAAAMAQLETARGLSDGAADFAEYEQRILHRIHTREIITRDQFIERFPDGWTAPQQETSE